MFEIRLQPMIISIIIYSVNFSDQKYEHILQIFFTYVSLFYTMLEIH